MNAAARYVMVVRKGEQMHRWGVKPPGAAARGLAVVAALAAAWPAAASSSVSAQPAWVAPALVALAIIVFAAVVMLRPAASAERALEGKPEPARAAGGIFVVTREVPAVRRAAPPPLDAEATPPRPPPGPAARTEADAPGPEAVVRRLSSRMDRVSYEPGSPNVLSMTKRLEGEADGTAAPGVRWTRSDDGEVLVLSIEGSLDTETAAGLAPVLDGIAAERRASVLLELSGLERVDGAGAATIARLVARSREHGGEVRAVGLAHQPRALFRLLRLDRALQLA